ncbi:MAG: DUF3429 domain-containing protein [Halofilum sp. (in: g-proteobacteria)]|nr:DUF3429 domain-containing protein [Halofilum sp. (in: g-proteobacteria)]
MSNDARTPRSIAILGYGGLLPFLGAGIGSWLPVSWAPAAVFAFMAYSAAILAFLGGLQWGLALRPDADRLAERVTVGVLPALVAALALPIGVRRGAWLLLAGFLLLLAWDLWRNRALLPPWYPRLRLRLTAGVVACHLLLLAGLWAG